ncbi:unnamed protein product [Colias eurytheme]|nr:unnamed protein product [Colias eurytheme]
MSVSFESIERWEISYSKQLKAFEFVVLRLLVLKVLAKRFRRSLVKQLWHASAAADPCFGAMLEWNIKQFVYHICSASVTFIRNY